MTTPWLRANAAALLRTLARIVIGGVWIVAGGLKVTDPLASANAVRAYQILPDHVAAVAGYALPWLEVALGVLLLLGLGTRVAAVATTALMFAFTAGIAQAWARGLAIDCGCFGGGGLVQEIPVREYITVMTRDTAIAAAAIWLALRPTTFFSVTDPHTTDEQDAP